MIDTYYNSMIEHLLLDLKKMVSVNEPETRVEYKTMNLKEWNKKKEFIDSIYNYEPNGKRITIMNYFNDTIYPLVSNGITLKMGFHKLYAIRVDDYDFRNMLSTLETYMTYQK